MRRWFTKTFVILATIPIVVPDAGCSADTAAQPPARKSTANPVRHDLEPLMKRFGALGTPVAASWVSGDMGDVRVPGPSMYWLDSVVELTADTARELKHTYKPGLSGESPDVWSTLRALLPENRYLTSEGLDAAFTTTTMQTKAFLAEHRPVIVLTAVAE